MHSLPAGGDAKAFVGVIALGVAVMVVIYALPFVILGAGVYAVAKNSGRSAPSSS